MSSSQDHTVSVWLVTQSCPVLCDPVDCSPPGSSVHGILRATLLRGLPFPPPGDLPDPGIEPTSLTFHALASEFFTTSATYYTKKVYS